MTDTDPVTEALEQARDALQRKLPSPKEPLRVARILIDERYSNGSLLLRAWRGGIWVWDATRWVEVEESKIRSDAYAFVEHAAWIDASKKEPEEKPWAPNRYKIADLVDAMRAATHLREDVHQPAWLEAVDAPPADELVAVTNGLLHVTTRDLLPHSPKYFNQTAVPFPYNPNAPKPKRWLKFLGELWPDDSESIEALQEFFGYVISGRTDHHKILLLVGPTRAGKGVIARVLKGLVGDGNHAGPSLASLATNFGLAPLIGKPLAIISDARLDDRRSSATVVERLLSVSGEDMVTIDRKYRDAWTGTLPTRFMVISNELPNLGDASGAIAARMIVLTLSRSWLGSENTRLTRELYEELPGILNWALDGLERLQNEDCFTEPEVSRDAIVALQDLTSPAAAFVRDRCERTGEAPCDALYKAWRLWAEDNGHKPGSAQSFGRNLRAAIPGLQTYRPREDGKQERRWYSGVSLKVTAAEYASHRVSGGGETQ